MAEMISPVAGDSELTCPVCLSPFSGQQVATLQNCQHTFCFECILEWSKVANSCPVDRISFDVIYQRLHVGGHVQNEIRVQRPAGGYEGEDGRARETVNCEVCGRSDRSHQLLVCSCCESGYHMNCLTPHVGLIPGDVWSCPDCAALSPPRSEDEQVSDEELMELLVTSAEGGPSTTASRLRPSTLSQLEPSTGIRRSQRIQNASGADASTAWPPCLHVPTYLIRATRSAQTGDGETKERP